jgi:RNA polymerase sigma-B factor
MAARLARRHRRSSEPGDDLEQVAYLGLVKSIDRYDPAAGSFLAYTITTIRGELKRHFRDHGWTMHISRPVQERYLQVARAIEGATHELGHTPTPKELAERTGLGLDEVVEALDASNGYSPQSLDAPVGSDPDDPSRTLIDTVGHIESGYDRVELGEALAPAFRSLPEREQQIVKLRFVDDLTQSEIAERCGVSQMHVSRLLRRSLNTLLSACGGDDADGAAA